MQSWAPDVTFDPVDLESGSDHLDRVSSPSLFSTE